MSSLKYPNIALHGKIAAGKSTVADILVNRFAYRRLSFAEPMHRVAALVREWAVHDSEPALMGARHVVDYVAHPYNIRVYALAGKHRDELLSGRKPRKFLQELGTLVRDVRPDAWVEYFATHAACINTQDVPWVCDDMRYENEADWCEQHGVLVNCWVPEQIRYSRMERLGYATGAENHASEAGLTREWGAVLDTGVTRECLEQQVCAMVERLRCR